MLCNIKLIALANSFITYMYTCKFFNQVQNQMHVCDSIELNVRNFGFIIKYCDLLWNFAKIMTLSQNIKRWIITFYVIVRTVFPLTEAAQYSFMTANSNSIVIAYTFIFSKSIISLIHVCCITLTDRKIKQKLEDYSIVM